MKPERFQKFFSDLYRDLVDKRLLVPLIGLAVAIVAVPMFLSRFTEPSAVPVTPGADIGDPTALEAAVTVSDTGVRDYRERLDRLRSKSPFEQQFTSTTTAAEGGTTDPVTGAGLPDSGTATTGSTDGSTAAPSTGAPPTDSSTGSVEITGGSPPVDPGPPSTDPDDEPEGTSPFGSSPIAST